MTAHKSRKHALIGFSSMARTRNCPGWVQFFVERKKQYKKKFGKEWEEKQKPAAAEGERLHELSENVLLEKLTLDDINDEDRGPVSCYTDLIDEIYAQHNPDTVQYLVEEKLSLEHLGGDCSGTPDCGVWSPGERIDMVDAKFGRGLVEPEKNYQLLTQLLAACEREDIGWEFKEIYLWISQPLVEHDKGPNRAWKIDISTVKLWRVELFDLIQMVMKPNAPLCAGAHCKWCPNLEDMDGIPSCPEIALEAKELARTEFDKFDPIAPEAATNSQLALILENADALRYWLDQCEAEGYARQVRGDSIPDVKIVRNPGRSSIDKKAYGEFVNEFEDTEGFYRSEPLTVGDFKKLMDENEIDYSEWQHVIKKGEGSLKLVSASDTRSEYIPAKVEFDE